MNDKMKVMTVDYVSGLKYLICVDPINTNSNLA